MRSGGRCGSLVKGVVFSSCNRLSVGIMRFWTTKNNTCLAVRVGYHSHLNRYGTWNSVPVPNVTLLSV